MLGLITLAGLGAMCMGNPPRRKKHRRNPGKKKKSKSKKHHTSPGGAASRLAWWRWHHNPGDPRTAVTERITRPYSGPHVQHVIRLQSGKDPKLAETRRIINNKIMKMNPRLRKRR